MCLDPPHEVGGSTRCLLSSTPSRDQKATGYFLFLSLLIGEKKKKRKEKLLHNVLFTQASEKDKTPGRGFPGTGEKSCAGERKTPR